MRGIDTSVNQIRRQVFTEVARLAYEGGDYSRIEELPYKILPGEQATYRESIFLERAIIGERLRLSIGLPVRKYTEHAPIAEGIYESAIAKKYYEHPLVNIIKFACNACPEKLIKVTSACQGCLAHPCSEVCPTNAISIIDRKSVIDQSKCIKCERCKNACPYDAITKQERPCAKACGVNAISSDELGRAEIDYDKCVSCGMCLVNCPFGAIADKGQIFQVIHAIKTGVKVYAAIAPAFVGQFGKKVTPMKLKTAMKKLGFAGVVEVAIGADLCTIEEAEDFVNKVPEKVPFLATSCCPAWSAMARKQFPELSDSISMALTPMVLTGRLIKKEHPGCKVVFIGPCAAKKLEASDEKIRSDIDFVLTFEELIGMFEAKDIGLEELEDEKMIFESSEDGRGFPLTGGVAQAVANCIHGQYPDKEIKVEVADGLFECVKMLKAATKGQYDGYLLEGMGCPGGCVGGAGTRIPINQATRLVTKYKGEAPISNSFETKYRQYLDLLE